MPATSKPLSTLTPLQASISHSLNRLLSPPIFEAFLSTSSGYGQFETYLKQVSRSSEGLAALSLWRDLQVLRAQTSKTSAAAQGIRDMYLLPSGPKRADSLLSPEDFTETVGGLAKIAQAGTGLDSVSKHLLDSLYREDFHAYVKFYLIKHTSVELGKYGVDSKDRKGL